MDRDGEFQLEFKLSSIQSVFEHKFRIKMFQNSMKMGKLETSYFSFGLYDWSLSIYPTGRADSQLGNILNTFDIKYELYKNIINQGFPEKLQLMFSISNLVSGTCGSDLAGPGAHNQATSMTIYLNRQNHLDRTCR